MWDEGMESNWSRVAEGVMLEIREWREQHGRTGRRGGDSRDAMDIRSQSGDSRSLCPECGRKLERRGQKVRKLFTHHDQLIELKRSYGVCPACGTGIFPPG